MNANPVNPLSRPQTGIRRFLSHQSLAPFEVMWAFFCIYAGTVAIINFGVTVTPLAAALGPKIAILFNGLFIVSGLAIYFGMGLRKANLEAFGLVLLATSLAVRTVVSTWYFGMNPMAINGYVLNGAFAVSCVVRLRTIWHWSEVK